MIRPHATRTLALNGLAITATISRDDDAVLKTCGDKYPLEDMEGFKFCTSEEYEMKCRQRREYYDTKNKEKSIENSKDSLDLMFEKKRGIGKSSSVDFQQREKEPSKVKSGTMVQKRRRESSLDKIERIEHLDSLPAEFYEKPNGIPRSVSDIPDIQKRKIKKWCESDFYRTAYRVSRRDSVFALIPAKSKKFSEENESSKRNFDDAEHQPVYVEVREDLGKKCRNGEKDKIFRNIRSRSATIPRKWSEHSLSTPSTTSDEVDDLPDGSCFRRTIHRPNLRRNLNRNSAAIRTANYVGSFPVAGADQAARAEYVRNKLLQLRGNVTIKPVLLVISLSGIKVCSTDGKSVHMAHALRRISYATCDPEGTQFSFLAREPRGHFSLQYCHSFVTQTPEQEILLGVCMRIMGRLGHHKSGASSRPFLRVHYRKLVEDYADVSSPLAPLPDYFSYCCCRCGHTQKVKAEELNSIVGNAFRMAYAAQLQRQPTFQEVIASQLQDSPGWQKNLSPVEMNVKLRDSPSLRLLGGKDPPKSIPGLRPLHNLDPEPLPNTPSSDESTSPTELNSYKKLAEKPPLIKRLAMGLTNNERTEDSRPLVTPTATSPLQRPLSGGYVNEAVTDTEFSKNQTKHIEIETTRCSQNSDQELKSKRISQISSSSSGSCPTGTTRPPPPPERIDSLTGKAEEGELRAAPWFQAGIPREITLEVLGQEPVGAFMVRESTSKPGCYALSLRVPRDFQPSGIAHYLIMRTAKGYKIKGFTKEFTTLTALITHHSVMPELLPCPLSLSRFNASFTQSDSGRDFADTDSDPDYDTLADFRRMMADLNV